MNGNTFGNKQDSFGGGYQLYRSVAEMYEGGGMIKDLPMMSSTYIYAGGTPVKATTNGVYEMLNFYKVTEATSGTTVKVHKAIGLGKAIQGRFLMVAPTELDGTGKAVTITSIDSSNRLFDILTLSADLGSLSIGDLLCDASANGVDVPAYTIPNSLSRRDVVVVDGDFAGTVAGVYDARIFGNHAPYMSDAVKKAVPQIHFDINN